MSQCLRCSKLCEPTAVFCEQCRSLVRYQLRQGPCVSASLQGQPSTSGDYASFYDQASTYGGPLARMSNPFQSNSVPDEAHPGAPLAGPDQVQRAVNSLNEAARLIENDRKSRLSSHPSRLSPLVEIADDIRRESTSWPASPHGGNSFALAGASGGLPDDWPWLGGDTQDKELDSWDSHTDPLIARHIPTSAESARIEEQDQRRALQERRTTPFPTPFLRLRASRVRIAFLTLVVCALVALLADGLLLTAVLTRPHRNAAPSHGYPTLTLSTDTAAPGSKVMVTLAHFPPSTLVALTHDIQEPISIDDTASITTNAQGNATFALIIDTSWGPGFHLLVAEDVASHESASANLQIIGEGVSHPAHLLLDTTPIDMGADYVGTDTLRSLALANSGNGSISWSASSDASWLLVGPSQGIFSQKEVISLGVERLGLLPGDYRSSLTISSNIGPSQRIEVDMSVRPLPRDAGPVLSLTPPLLSFMATDGEQNTMQQRLTISNPSSRPLQWSLAPAQNPACPWLAATPSAGTVPAAGSTALAVLVQSQCLLPGTYSGTLTFRAPGAIDSSQTVAVSLVVQPRCGLLTSTGLLAFTVVAGQNTQANQSLSLNSTASCAGATIPWSSSSNVSWLSVTPGSGQFQGAASSVVTVGVNAAGLTASPNPYRATLAFVFGQSTLTVLVQITVQAPPAPTAPLMSVSPLNLSYNTVQGQSGPSGQVVAITNNGHGPLSWNVTAQPFPSLAWFAASPLGGSIAVGQSAQITVNVNTAHLSPGTYMGQLTLNGTDAKGNAAAGSPQTVAVNLVVQPPCTLSQPSSSALSFSGTQGVSAPAPTQSVQFNGTGSCVWPLSWKTGVAPAAPWLTRSPSSGSIGGSGQSGSIGVGVQISGLVAGSYSATVTIAATDSSTVNVQGSTQTFTVTLTVLPPPCVLSPPAPARLAFTAPAGQPPATGQSVTLVETGTCARPVAWTASANARSSGWLILTSTSGSDSGGGSTLGVNVNAAHLTPGTYTGTITITATDSSGASVPGSGRTLSVLLRVTATLSGSVVACPGSTPPTCATPQPLPAATVTLQKGAAPIATTTADASGNYTFSGVAPGSYIISVAGTDASNTPYAGSMTLTLSANMSNVTLQAFPG